MIRKKSGGYEFDLEVNGVLKTWTVGKSIARKNNKSLTAMATADHLLSQFEVAKQENSISDIGTYDLIEGSYANGFLRVYLAGEKFKGEWILSRDVGARTWRLEPSPAPEKGKTKRTKSGTPKTRI
jgi:hypothetical protein